MMRSVVWSGPLAVGVVEKSRPTPLPHEALVQVLFCGLCGSDVDEYLHGPVVAVPPLVLGHEFSGVVVEPAADGTGPEAGTVVVIDVVTGCGRCFWCERHEEGLCADLRVTGQHVDGGLSEFVAARADRLIPVPGGVSALEASLAEPLAVAVRALRKVGDLRSAQVLIVGGGTIGMLTAQVAVAWGAGTVAVIEPHPIRRELITGWGITALWGDDPSSRSELVAQAFSHPGPGVVVECTGRPGMLSESLALARSGGVVLALGVNAAPESIDSLDLVLTEKTVRGSAAHMWDTDVTDAVGLIAAGRVDVASLVTHVLDLESAVSAFDLAAAADGATIKVVVRCGTIDLKGPDLG